MSARNPHDVTKPHGAIEAAWIELAVNEALTVREKAYAPYSNFLVGAALVDCHGHLVVGCNIENASYSLTNCAERVALQRGYLELDRDWVLMVVASRGAVTPCGACRQVLSEFVPKMSILLVDADGSDRRIWTDVESLLPGAFRLSEQARDS